MAKENANIIIDDVNKIIEILINGKEFEMPDEYGYPTEDELEYIKSYRLENNTGWIDFMEYIKSIWWTPDLIRFDSYKWHVSTGGWSGNEEIIKAMMQNKMFWMLYWEQSRRGGHYIFSKLRQEDI